METIVKNDNILIFGIVLFLFGVVLRFTDALDIIHEYMHVAFAATDGHKAISVSQSSTVFEKLTPLIIYTGYYGEAMLYGGLTFLSIFFYKPIALFFFGIYHAVIVSAYYSHDFNEIAMRYFGDRGIINANLNRWLFLTITGGLVLWVMMIRAQTLRK